MKDLDLAYSDDQPQEGFEKHYPAAANTADDNLGTDLFLVQVLSLDLQALLPQVHRAGEVFERALLCLVHLGQANPVAVLGHCLVFAPVSRSAWVPGHHLDGEREGVLMWSWCSNLWNRNALSVNYHIQW